MRTGPAADAGPPREKAGGPTSRTTAGPKRTPFRVDRRFRGRDGERAVDAGRRRSRLGRIGRAKPARRSCGAVRAHCGQARRFVSLSCLPPGWSPPGRGRSILDPPLAPLPHRNHPGRMKDRNREKGETWRGSSGHHRAGARNGFRVIDGGGLSLGLNAEGATAAEAIDRLADQVRLWVNAGAKAAELRSPRARPPGIKMQDACTTVPCTSPGVGRWRITVVSSTKTPRRYEPLRPRHRRADPLLPRRSDCGPEGRRPATR